MAVEKGKYVFTWKVENFSLWLLMDEKFSSNNFKAETIGGSEWYLSINSIKNDSYSLVSCGLYRINNDNEESVDIHLQLIGNDGEILCHWNREEVVVDEEGVFCKNYLSLDKLYEKMKNCKEYILTLRCIITGDSLLMNNPACESIAWTKIAVDQCCFLWSVDIPDDDASWERSRNIFMSERIYFNMTLTSTTDDIEINIQNLIYDESGYYYIVSCKISLISVKGNETVSKSAKHLFHTDDNQVSWKFPVFLFKKILQSEALDLIQNNSYTLKCEISASDRSFITETKTLKFKDPILIKNYLDDSLLALQEDLRNMLKTNISSDVKLQVGNQTIPVNKCVLQARSPVFSRMFEQDMLENNTGIVEIEDFDVETVNLFLEFIYTGNVVNLNFKRSKEVMIAADKYQIPSLTNKCFLFLVSQLSVKNVCEVYTLADMINHTQLKVSALEFIERNSAEVIRSEVWSDWMANNYKLASEILFKLTLKFCK